jgi:hypothetical protein
MKDSSVPSSGDVNPSEVADFLAEKMPDLKAGVTVNLPVSQAQPAATAPALTPDPAFAPAAVTTAKVIETLIPSGDLEFSAADIEPSPAEKESFLASVLTDSQVELEITLPGLPQASALVRSRNNAEQALLLAVLDLDQQEKRIGNTMTYIVWLQYYDAALRLLSFGKQKLPPLAYSGEPDIKVAAAEMRAKVEKYFLPMSSLRWKIVASAIRLFDLKLNAAANLMVQRNFSPPAG